MKFEVLTDLKVSWLRESVQGLRRNAQAQTLHAIPNIRNSKLLVCIRTDWQVTTQHTVFLTSCIVNPFFRNA